MTQIHDYCRLMNIRGNFLRLLGLLSAVPATNIHEE